MKVYRIVRYEYGDVTVKGYFLSEKRAEKQCKYENDGTGVNDSKYYVEEIEINEEIE